MRTPPNDRRGSKLDDSLILPQSSVMKSIALRTSVAASPRRNSSPGAGSAPQGTAVDFILHLPVASEPVFVRAGIGPAAGHYWGFSSASRLSPIHLQCFSGRGPEISSWCAKGGGDMQAKAIIS
jgi:hypothetical protein